MKLAIPEISEGEKYLGAIMPLSNVGLGGWFPIETAPKDGTQFIAYKQPDDLCNVPFWVIAKYVRRYDLMPYGQNYDEDYESDEEMDEFGIKALVTSWNHKNIADTGFTHWMPLPKPPNV